MRSEALTNVRIEEFIDYCKRYRREVDDSFLYDEDLKKFKADNENPTYIVVDDEGKISAAASLIVDEYMRRGRKGRFRIFHSSLNKFEHFSELLKAVLTHTEELDKIIVFLQIANEKFSSILERLNFTAERYSYLLVREVSEIYKADISEGYEIRPMEIGKDEEDWCKIRNESFAKLLGSETPVTVEMIAKMNSGEDFIEGGAMMLYHNGRAVGLVRAAKDEYENMPIVNIGPLAIIPEYQGKGLGRILLRTAVNFASEKGYSRTILCVNAENERAKSLYLQEGFKQVEAVACYKYNV